MRFVSRFRGLLGFGSTTVKTLPSMPAACRYLEGRAAALSCDGVALNTMVAGVDSRDPSAVQAFVMPRADALARAAASVELEPLTEWLVVVPERAEQLNVIMTDGEQCGSALLGDLVAGLQKIESEHV